MPFDLIAQSQYLVGRTIVSVRLLDAAEREGLAWYLSPIVIELDDGSYLMPSKDSEGNAPGSLFAGKGNEFWTLAPTIPPRS